MASVRSIGLAEIVSDSPMTARSSLVGDASSKTSDVSSKTERLVAPMIATEPSELRSISSLLSQNPQAFLPRSPVDLVETRQVDVVGGYHRCYPVCAAP